MTVIGERFIVRICAPNRLVSSPSGSYNQTDPEDIEALMSAPSDAQIQLVDD
jgi:hypothetical protein